MNSVRKGEQPWGTTRNEDRLEGGWRKTTSGGDDEGGVDRLGEKREERKRERKIREKEEEVGGNLSFGLVVPNGVARLSRAVCSGRTKAQMANSECPASHTTVVNATESL
jgi:hypothetical protein